jgi:O-acetylhomoserine (thiol)-lyase
MRELHIESQVLHNNRVIDDTGALAGAIHRTAAYQFKSTEHAANLFGLKELGYIYTRLTNPTVSLLENRMAAIEGGAAAVATASGTSALHYTFLNICRHGDEIVASSTLYGGTYSMLSAILPDQGIQTKFVDIHNLEQVQNAIGDKTKILFTEVIGNPALDVANIKALAKIAKDKGIPLVVDSTFTPPTLFKPLAHGASIVIHSLTKWIGGHGTVLGGIAIEAGGFDWTNSRFALYNEPDAGYHGLRFGHDLGGLGAVAFSVRFRTVPLRNLGAAMSPDNAWQIMQGLETLPLRMQKHSSNALAVAQYLQKHPKVSWVRYPGLPEDEFHAIAAEQFEDNGFGGMVVFGLQEGKAAGEKFIDSLQMICHVANVGDVKSLAIHPASTTHSQLSEKEQALGGISPEMVRLSVGIEHIDDIIADIEQAIG